MTAVSELPKAPGEDQAAATQVTLDALKTYDDLDGIFAITSVALPGAAEALQKEDAADDVFLTGLATPNDMREYVEDGTVKKFVLWSPVDLGYLAVHVAKAAQEGRLEPGAESFEAGRLGEVEVRGDVVILGDPIVFTPENINDYDF
jgi:ABC-type sugar transport system substrate-binding protein